MDKLLLYPQNLSRKERDVFLLTEDRRYLLKQAASANRKFAYHPQVQKYIEQAKPMEGLVQALITALGAGEYWGDNINADWFGEEPLSHRGPDYGVDTFKTNANYFTHHVNQNPALAKGKVILAVWNENAKRVELVIGIDPARDPEGAAMVDRGEPITTSMGAKLPYDVCNICLNKAKTRAEYCDHLRYLLRQIDPDTGKAVFARNPHPKFFDISRVLIPADKTAYMWEKIASAAAPSRLGSAHLAELPPGAVGDPVYLDKVASELEQAYGMKRGIKQAAVAKKAFIKKQIPGVSVVPRPGLSEVPAQAAKKVTALSAAIKLALDRSAKPIPRQTFESVAKSSSLPELLSSLVTLAIAPTPDEARTIGEIFTGKKAEGLHRVSPECCDALAPFIPERSFSPPVLMIRLRQLDPKMVKRAAEESRHKKQPGTFEQGIKQGLLVALAAMFVPEKLRDLFLNHPIPLLLAGLPIAAAAKTLASSNAKPLVSGQYDLAGGSQDLYTQDWRRRFVDLQARPVAVIKTGSVVDLEALSWFPKLGHHPLEGVSGLIYLSEPGQTPETLGDRLPVSLLARSLLTQTPSDVAEVSSLLEKAASVMGTGELNPNQLPMTNRLPAQELLLLQAMTQLAL